MMAKGMAGTRTPPQNNEGSTVTRGQMTKTGIAPEFLDKNTKSSLNAKKQSPYGPQLPGLAAYFRMK